MDRNNWNYFKIIWKIPEPHTGEVIQDTTENSHIGSCTHTAVSSNAEVQNHSTWEIALHVP